MSHYLSKTSVTLFMMKHNRSCYFTLFYLVRSHHRFILKENTGIQECGRLLSDPRTAQFGFHQLNNEVQRKFFRKYCLPSGSRSCGMPNSVSASKKASCRFSRLGLLNTRSMSTSLGRREWITAKNAKPVRQLGPKSFTSSPKRLEKTRGSQGHGVQQHGLQCIKHVCVFAETLGY